MKRLFLSSLLLLLLAAVVCPSVMKAAVEITRSSGWLESAYVEWTKETGYLYNVYICSADGSWTKLDNELVREYATYGRADALGLAAGDYKMKVVPVKDNAEVTADAAETATLTVKNYDRGGYAHFKSGSTTFSPANGVGAYKNDGTLKSGAKVFYVTADNAKTITTDVVTNNKGGVTTGVGLQDIITLYQKGYDKTPIAFRIIGTVKKENLDRIDSSAEGLQVKGKNSYSELNITIEGVGFDATVHGFGFLLRNACSVELRNFAIMWCMDDAVSMDTDNSNIWAHHLDLFYGKPGGASDQAKGDGTIDVKGDSQYITIAYNHFWDSGKSSLCGMTSESGPNWITYHHNWFDHSDSRHPRIRTMSVHVYNNYYDGNSKYGVGAAKSSNAFVESNYFRNCKYPMLTSKQGSDVNNGEGSSDQTKGTFSGEDGGVIKAYGNYMIGQKRFQPWAATGINNTHYDAYVVTDKSEKVPADVKALQGGRTYDNFDTNPETMYSGYTCHEASEVPAVVTGEYGAGRCNHGDFSWTFGEAEDTNDAVISSLSTAIQNYKSTLLGFFGKTVSNGGANEGDNTGGSNEGGDNGDDNGEDNPITNGTIYSWNDNVGTTVLNGVTEGKLGNYNGLKIGSNANYIQISPVESAGGFKAGDVLYIAGYADGADRPLVITSSATNNKTDILHTTAAVANRKNNEIPTEEAYTLTADYPSLDIWRGASSTTYVTTIYVVRSEQTDGITMLETSNHNSSTHNCFDLSGRRIVTPVKGQIYIVNGKKIVVK